MKRVAERWLVLALVGGLLLVSGAMKSNPVDSKAFQLPSSQGALALVGEFPAGMPAGVVVTCAGYNCSREHDLVYYDLSRDAQGRGHIRFADARTLDLGEEEIPIRPFLSDGPLLYDPFYGQAYAFDSRTKCNAYGTDCYQQAWVHIVSGRKRIKASPINDAFNSSQPVDRFYYIEGVAIKPHGADIRGGTTLIVDNTPNGNLDIVQIRGDGQDVASVERYSYRESLCGETQCHWTGNLGNSLALDDYRGMLYLADNNSPFGQVRAFRFGPNVHSETSPIDVTQSALCFVHLRQVAVAQYRDTLYVPTACQSYEFGSTVLVDTEFGTVKGTVQYRYGDQGIIAVDSHDPRRVFLTTSDRIGIYDTSQWLTLHMLYDDIVVASLPLMQGYQTGWLRTMVFDPVSNRLYLAVNDRILVVAVRGVPPAEMWPAPVTAPVTPDHGGTLGAGDGSATFYFKAESVAQTSLMTYAEGPDTIARTAQAAPSSPMRALRTIRTFGLTGVISGTTTVVDGFDQAFTLNAETTPRERAGIMPGTLALYWWDDHGWVAQPTSQINVNTIYAASSRTGRFALMGETRAVYLPVVRR